MSAVTQAYRVIKPFVPGINLARKLVGNKFARQVRVIVGGNPANPNNVYIKAVLMCLPMVIWAIPNFKNETPVITSGIELSKRLVTVATSSAQALKLLSKTGVRLNSSRRYVLFFMIYSVWSMASQMVKVNKRRGEPA